MEERFKVLLHRLYKMSEAKLALAKEIIGTAKRIDQCLSMKEKKWVSKEIRAEIRKQVLKTAETPKVKRWLKESEE